MKWVWTSMMKYSPLGHFSSAAVGLERFGFVDVPVVAVDLVAWPGSGGQAHGAGHEGAAVHAELLRLLVGHRADQVLDLLLLGFCGRGMNSSLETTWVGTGESTPFLMSRCFLRIHMDLAPVRDSSIILHS